MPLISHRGAAGLAPENSLEAITIANRYKPVYIEVDIHRTIDGIFVLYHGDMKRTLSGAPRPETFNLLKESHPYLTTLNKALKHKSEAPYILDIKFTEGIHDLVKTLRDEQMPESFSFTSPHPGALFELKKAFPKSDTFISQPYWHGPIAAFELARDYGFTGITLNKWWLNPFTSWLCKRYGKQLNVYTINHSHWMWAVQKFFPHAFITTNYPNRYRRHFDVKKIKNN
ncbi:MAG: glycerophosphodiester phosphodiesterase [bacterium]|nr:glycerophosphodiester phosphodiesterase [bacterium]